MTKQHIRDEFQRLGIELDETLIEQIHASATNPLNPLQSIFEPMLEGWQTHFNVGDTVMLIREFFGVPTLAMGVITEIEFGFDTKTERPKEDWEVSTSFLKGRPLTVRFDVSAFKIPFSEQLRKQASRYTSEELPEFW